MIQTEESQLNLLFYFKLLDLKEKTFGHLPRKCKTDVHTKMCVQLHVIICDNAIEIFPVGCGNFSSQKCFFSEIDFPQSGMMILLEWSASLSSDPGFTLVSVCFLTFTVH